MSDSKLSPLSYRVFAKYLESIGCRHVRTKGDHTIWTRAGLPRPLVVRKKHDIPVFEIRNNLRTLDVTVEAFLGVIRKLR